MRKIVFTFSVWCLVTTVNAQQSVGIGTTSPNTKAQLDVVSTTKGLLIPRMTSSDRLGIQSPIPPGLMVYETTTNSFWFYNGTSWVQLASGGGSHWTASGTHIYNTNTGSVGIGTPTPTSKLHVLGSLRLESSGPDLQFASDGISKVYVQSDGNDLRMGTNSGNTGGSMIIRMNGTNKIFIDSAGKMGINRILPKEELDVNGKVRITPNGNNPFGGESADAELKLYGNPQDISNSFGPAQISFYNWVSLGGGDYDYVKKYRMLFEGGTAERLTLFHADHDNQLVLNKFGRVGIGTSTPSEKLHISGGSLMVQDGTPVLKLKSTSPLASVAQPAIEFSSPSAELAKIKYLDGGLELTGRSGNSPDLVLKNGNVGIGVSNPSEKLSVLGNMTMNWLDPTIQFTVSGVDKGFVQNHGDDLRIGTNSSNVNGKFVVRTAAGDNFYVDAAGYVGIGASPGGAEARLHVGTGLDASLSSNGYMMLGNSAGTNLILDNNEIMARGGNGATGSLVFQNDGGTVRIGSVAVPAGYKFAINGKMICEELKVKLVSSGWPDYVFGDDHQLLSLPELEKFIKQNKHLPNIPSAAEVEANGIEVGDMQKRMMEKIEELTLYIIDLKKELEILKAKK